MSWCKKKQRHKGTFKQQERRKNDWRKEWKGDGKKAEKKLLLTHTHFPHPLNVFFSDVCWSMFWTIFRSNSGNVAIYTMGINVVTIVCTTRFGLEWTENVMDCFERLCVNARTLVCVLSFHQSIYTLFTNVRPLLALWELHMTFTHTILLEVNFGMNWKWQWSHTQTESSFQWKSSRQVSCNWWTHCSWSHMCFKTRQERENEDDESVDVGGKFVDLIEFQLRRLHFN